MSNRKRRENAGYCCARTLDRLSNTPKAALIGCDSGAISART
ncbi:MAG: hypothetical protein ACYS76_02230 [Planctomycetota bacterium]